MIQQVSAFFFKLVIICCFIFTIHVVVLNNLHLDKFDNLIIPSYIFNVLFTVVVFTILLNLQKKYGSSLGFIFMFSSLVKFLFFFILFNPYYKVDNMVESVEFCAFFIPYSITLGFEIIYLIKILNQPAEK